MVTVKAVHDRLVDQAHRYLDTSHLGLQVDFAELMKLVAEFVVEYTDHAVAERNAAWEQAAYMAEDLAWDMHAARETAAGETARVGGER